MIAAFALYATVLSVVIGVVARLAHQGALLHRVPTRFVWLAAMLLMVFAPIAAGLATARVRVTVPAMSAVVVDAPFGASSGLDSRDTAALPDTRDSWRQWPQAFDELLRATAARARPLDPLFGALWAFASLTVLLVAVRAARQLRALRSTLVTHEIEGATVYLSKSVGPAAVGGATPAIVVPEWVLSLDRSLLTLVLKHEQEHLAARDPALLTVGLALLIAVPWLPPLWWCGQRLRLAIELDCDARVLRAHPSPRAYAQLLLFVSQRRASPSSPWPLLSPLTLAFNPQVHHLTTRIDAMTRRSSTHPLRLALIGSALLGAAAVATAIPAPSLDRDVQVTAPRPPAIAAPSARAAAATAPPAIVSITHTGLTFSLIPTTDSVQIVLYGNGPVRVGLGTQPRALLADTLVLNALPAFTADVSEGELHIELRRGARLLEVRGDVQGGTALSVGATGRHLVLNAGGTGIRTVREAGGAGAPGKPSGRSRTPVARATPAASMSEPLLADSVAARKAQLELHRLRLLAILESSSPPVRETVAQLDALDRLLATVPPRNRNGAIAEVLRTLDRRAAGLTADIAQRQTQNEMTSPMMVTLVRELDLLGARREELRAEFRGASRGQSR